MTLHTIYLYRWPTYLKSSKCSSLNFFRVMIRPHNMPCTYCSLLRNKHISADLELTTVEMVVFYIFQSEPNPNPDIFLYKSRTRSGSEQKYIIFLHTTYFTCIFYRLLSTYSLPTSYPKTLHPKSALIRAHAGVYPVGRRLVKCIIISNSFPHWLAF